MKLFGGKKAEQDYVNAFFGIFTALMVVVLGIAFLEAVYNTNRANLCKDIQGNLNTCNARLQSAEQQISDLKLRLNESNEKYNELITNNVTKKDIWDIQNQLNDTVKQINLLKTEYQIINNDVTNAYEIIIKQNLFYIKISFAVVFFFVLDFISFAFFKLDIKRFVINSVKKSFRLIAIKFSRKKDEIEKESEK